VYLNNSNLKFPIDGRKVLKQPIQGIQRQALVSIVKKVVFIKKENGFKAREIKTGIELNDFIQVLEGLGVKEALLTMHNI
jgi:Cu(I)/Ag(I) efflux system membrane fusion protein